MQKLHNWDALSVGILDTVKHRVKFTTLEDLVGKEKMPKLLDFAQNITEGIPVFMDLGEKDLNLATALTSKPYYFKQTNY
jgi:hypothetical protein